jgi:glycosyltransferase involved in cell wall biosynthesis
MDISLIIPAYNAEEYLADAIQSALGQTQCAKEILVVDDGSTDRTADVAASFGAPVRILRQENLGVSAARNLGIRSASCPWLAFLDSDDVMAPDRLEVQQQAFSSRPELEIALGMQIFFSGKQWSPSLVIDQPERPGLISSALFCRATTFERIGLFDPRYQGTEFIAWFVKAKEVGAPYAVVNRAVVYRRIHDKNLSRKQIQSTAAYPRLIKELLDQKRAD